MALAHSIPNAVTEAAEMAFTEAMGSGASPEAAITAAIDAGTSIAAGIGFPDSVLQGCGDFFHDSFSQSIESGMSPMDAFNNLAQEDPVSDASHEAFEGAIASGASTNDAMQAAVEAGTAVCQNLGIPPGDIEDAAGNFVDSFQSGLENGLTPTESFNQCTPPDIFGTGDGEGTWGDGSQLAEGSMAPPTDGLANLNDPPGESAPEMDGIENMAASMDQAAAEDMPPPTNASDTSYEGEDSEATQPIAPQADEIA
tara:strand:+ start:482 stop:1246 length:765 start_codon:yes stop_codon:yes gene_type:complete